MSRVFSYFRTKLLNFLDINFGDGKGASSPRDIFVRQDTFRRMSSSRGRLLWMEGCQSGVSVFFQTMATVIKIGSVVNRTKTLSKLSLEILQLYRHMIVGMLFYWPRLLLTHQIFSRESQNLRVSSQENYIDYLLLCLLICQFSGWSIGICQLNKCLQIFAYSGILMRQNIFTQYRYFRTENVKCL